MTLLLFPALISLLLKLTVLGYVLRGGKVSTVFLSLIAVFAAHNAIEVISYLHFFKSNANALDKLVTWSLALIATSLSITIFFSDLIIAGQTSITYSVTAIQGKLYSLFSIYSLSCLFSSLLILIYGYRSSTMQLDALRYKYSLLALSPVILVFSTVIIFKITNIQVNAAGVLPIATTLFLIIVLKTEAKHKLSDVKRFLPMSLENKTANNFLELLDFYVQNNKQDNVYKDLHKNIEKEIISYSLKKCDNNVADTAEMMGINRSSLYAMIDRLKIDLKEIRDKHH